MTAGNPDRSFTQLLQCFMRHIDRMSGGELQKVAGGRALVQETATTDSAGRE